MADYPLYDVPYLARNPNDHFMSWTRHKKEVLRRKKYGFLQKFPPEKEHIVQFDTIFAAEFQKSEK